MIRRLLLTAATSALLVVCTIIALEALGLLFQRGTPEPVINSVLTPDIPEESAVTLFWKRQDELALARIQAEQERLYEAEQQEAARQAGDEERSLADALRWAEQYRRRREAEVKLAALGPPPVTDARGQVEPQPDAAVEPQPRPQQTRELKLAAATAATARVHRTAYRPAARPDRPRVARRGASRDTAAGCPLLGWIETLMAPPSPRRRAT
jgi:hypothetical protein